MGEILKRAEVVAEALSWEGTRYHHHGRIKGVGVDCAMLLAEVFEAVEMVQHVDAGTYPREWHLHHSDELFLGWLQRCGAVEVATPRAGDVAVYRFGLCYSHGGIFIDNRQTVLHAHIGSRRVIRTLHGEAPLAGVDRKCFTLFKASA